MKTLTGILRVTSDGQCWLESGDTFTQIYVGAEDLPALPFNRRMAVTVDADNRLIQPEARPLFVLLKGPRADTDPTKKHIVIFLQHGDLDEDELEVELARLSDECITVRNFYRHFGEEFWDVEVRGFMMPLTGDPMKDTPHPPQFAWGAMRQFMKEHPEQFEDFNPNYHHCHTRVVSQAHVCGKAWLGGNKGVTYRNCNADTIIHELGHNFGLGHAGTQRYGEAVKEYGDRITSIMGGGQQYEPLNARNLLELGLEHDREIITLRDGPEARALLLGPYELSRHSMRRNEYQIAVLRGEETHYLGLGKVRGCPYPTDPDTEDALFILSKASDGDTIRLVPDLRPGGSITVDGFLLDYQQYLDETASVVITPHGAMPLPEDGPIQIINSVFPEPLGDADPQPGLWWDQDYNGQGFHIMDEWLWWFTFDQAGRPRFYFGRHADGEFDLLTTDGGSWEDPGQAREWSVGRARVDWLTPSNAIFHFFTEEHGRGAIELEPLAFPTNHRIGIWFDPELNKSGFTLQEAYNPKSERDEIVVLFYCYGEPAKDHYQRPMALTSQRWYIGTSPRLGNLYNLKFKEMVGGKFLAHDPAKDAPAGWGSLDTDTMRLIVDLYHGRRQTFNLRELTTGPVTIS